MNAGSETTLHHMPWAQLQETVQFHGTCLASAFSLAIFSFAASSSSVSLGSSCNSSLASPVAEEAPAEDAVDEEVVDSGARGC